ncbi:MAG TPA: hypothetical protein VEC18_10260, partial [Myxococcota bacterium]|nr:hypothetical protein [Myxococcota bacterium]
MNASAPAAIERAGAAAGSGATRAIAIESAAPATPAVVHAGIPHEIAEREYRASAIRGGLQAPNRAHDLRTYFETSGIRVHSRTGDSDSALLSLSLVRLGRGATPPRVAPGELT